MKRIHLRVGALLSCVRRTPALTVFLLAFVACRSPQPGRHIVVCGQRVPVDAPVVLWSDPGGYDAYSVTPLPYKPGRGVEEQTFVEGDEDDPAPLFDVVDQLVLHYDVSGASRACFDTLQRRGLSVHFLLDLDGTIYQTLDLRDQAWHATKANVRSIGIEIAQIGAYPPGSDTLDTWYPTDEDGPYVRLPEILGDGDLRTPRFIARPARPERVRGTINGNELEQHDFTPEQMDSLVELTAALCRFFPRLEPAAPLDANGDIVPGVLDEAAYEAFTGLLGHYHVQANKSDPGPAFDWPRYLARVEEALLAPARD